MYRNIHPKQTNRSEFLLLSGEGKNGLNHFKYWIPELLKAKVSFSILVRRKELFKLVQKEYRMLNILLAESALDVEDTLTKMSNLRAVFFMSNPSNNIHVLRFNKYKHIFLGSENSDRDAQVTKVLRVYDELWLSSQSSIDKLKLKMNIDHLVIKKIGKPQLKKIVTSLHNGEPKSILLLVSKEDNIYSNRNVIAQIMKAIPKGYHLKILLEESLNKNVLLKDLRMQLSEFSLLMDRDFTIYDSFSDDLLAGSDYILCDCNNYQQKFLATNALVCLYKPKNAYLESLFEDKYISFECIPQFSNNEELEDVFTETKVLLSKQKEFSEYWIGSSYTLNDDFINNLQHLSVS